MISERVHPLDAQALALFEAKGTHGWFPAGNVNGVKVRRIMQIIRDFHKASTLHAGRGFMRSKRPCVAPMSPGLMAEWSGCRQGKTLPAGFAWKN